MTQTLIIAFGGALGAAARYWASSLVALWLGRDFPYGALVVNVAGSFLMGFLSIWLAERVAIAPEWRSFLLIGLLGAFTTFSTFSLDTLHLLQQAAYIKAGMNVLLSVSFCLGAAYLGVILAKH